MRSPINKYQDIEEHLAALPDPDLEESPYMLMSDETWTRTLREEEDYEFALYEKPEAIPEPDPWYDDYGEFEEDYFLPLV